MYIRNTKTKVDIRRSQLQDQQQSKKKIWRGKKNLIPIFHYNQKSHVNSPEPKSTSPKSQNSSTCGGYILSLSHSLKHTLSLAQVHAPKKLKTLSEKLH